MNDMRPSDIPGAPPLRTQKEIQHAHDLLVGVIVGEAPIELNKPNDISLRIAASVLCWVLHHDHNDAFDKVLEDVEKRCADVGFHLTRPEHN
jgi:hypothetical protein